MGWRGCRSRATSVFALRVVSWRLAGVSRSKQIDEVDGKKSNRNQKYGGDDAENRVERARLEQEWHIGGLNVDDGPWQDSKGGSMSLL